MSKRVRLCQWKAHKPPVHGIILYQRHLDTGISHNLWFGFVNIVEVYWGQHSCWVSQCTWLSWTWGCAGGQSIMRYLWNFFALRNSETSIGWNRWMLPRVGNQVMMFLFSRWLTFGMGSAAENMVCLSLKAMLMNFAIGHIFVK